MTTFELSCIGPIKITQQQHNIKDVHTVDLVTLLCHQQLQAMSLALLFLHSKFINSCWRLQLRTVSRLRANSAPTDPLAGFKRGRLVAG
jgi:hypothetical protein